MKKLVCEMCGGTDIIKENGVFVCQSCGCKYSIEDAKKMMSEDAPVAVTVKEPVKIVNNEFESKLAEAETWEHIYFERGENAVVVGNLRGFDAVQHYYSRVEAVGANEYKYWEKFADFVRKGMIYAFENKEKVILNKAELISGLSTIMDFAIKYADDANKDRLIKKKDDLIKEYDADLNRIQYAQEQKLLQQKLMVTKFSIVLLGFFALIMFVVAIANRDELGGFGLFYSLISVVAAVGCVFLYKNIIGKLTSEIDDMKSNMQARGMEIPSGDSSDKRVMYICKSCKATYSGDPGKTEACPTCKFPTTPMNISVLEWRKKTNEEKNVIKSNY